MIALKQLENEGIIFSDMYSEVNLVQPSSRPRKVDVEKVF